MLIFRCPFTSREVTEIKSVLPASVYCLLNKPGEDIYYGVILDEHYEKVLDILSGETLGLLEYLDEEELQKFISSAGYDVIGNEELVKKS